MLPLHCRGQGKHARSQGIPLPLDTHVPCRSTQQHMHAACLACYLGTPPRWRMKAQLQGCSNAAAQTRRKKSRQRDKAVSWEVMEQDRQSTRRKQRDLPVFPRSQLCITAFDTHRLQQYLLKGNHTSPPSPQLLAGLCQLCPHQPSQEGHSASARAVSVTCPALYLGGEGKWALTGMKLALM